MLVFSTARIAVRILVVLAGYVFSSAFFSYAIRPVDFSISMQDWAYRFRSFGFSLFSFVFGVFSAKEVVENSRVRVINIVISFVVGLRFVFIFFSLWFLVYIYYYTVLFDLFQGGGGYVFAFLFFCLQGAAKLINIRKDVGCILL